MKKLHYMNLPSKFTKTRKKFARRCVRVKKELEKVSRKHTLKFSQNTFLKGKSEMHHLRMYPSSTQKVHPFLTDLRYQNWLRYNVVCYLYSKYNFPSDFCEFLFTQMQLKRNVLFALS